MIYRFQPIHSYTFSKKLTSSSCQLEISDFFESLIQTEDRFVTNISQASSDGISNQERRSEAEVMVIKEVHDLEAIIHSVLTDRSISLVGIVRDPVEVLRSWINTPREWNQDWKIEDEWWHAKSKNSEYPGNHFGVEQWILTTEKLLNLQRAHKDRVRVFRYENLTDNLDENMSEILDFLGLPKSPDMEAFCRKTQLGESSDGYSVFRGKSHGSGPLEIPDSIVSSIEIAVKKAGLEEFLS